MREVITRRYRKVVEDKDENMPELIIVDGGKGQLSSAIRSIDNLGLKNYNIIGLAKRLEEIFHPGNPEPQSIPKTSSSLKILQRIRDEAHRFAITFHRQRRSKRIFTSELLEIIGIGDKVAEKLLRDFRSIEEIRTAQLEDLELKIGNSRAKIIFDHYHPAS